MAHLRACHIDSELKLAIERAMIIPFQKITENDRNLGGKAWGLGILAQQGFPVPPGLVVDQEPSESEWQEILKWWKSVGNQPLAVRSSAGAEDSAEQSFAGQNRSFLNVDTEAQLIQSIRDCFASYFRDNSKAYRKYFLGNTETGRMNVVIQVMVNPKFAGVYFSEDPLGQNRGWMVEVVEGLAEDLVSGKVTPGRISKNGDKARIPDGFTNDLIQKVSVTGEAVSNYLRFPLDMEWAIDQNKQFYVIQARPITTVAKGKEDWIKKELARLERKYDTSVTWDGQTFAEWSGLPSYLTFSIWRGAFSPKHAFGNALQTLGYHSFSTTAWREDESVLGRVFGRAYINLDKMSELYYGPIPYKIVAKPRPHTQFDYKRINLKTILNFPAAVISMIRVAWNLSTKRKFYFNKCISELSKFKHRFSRPLDKEAIQKLSTERLRELLQNEADEFSKFCLYWPFVLVILTESTMQNIRLVMKGVLGEKVADQKLREWMGKGLHTVTLEMQREYSEACEKPELRAQFLARYGHRGPGEMDLANPRWFELGDQAFTGSAKAKAWVDLSTEVEEEIKKIPSFKRDMILDEWRWIKKILETREMWKMELLKPYAHIRLIIEELGRRRKMGSLIHWTRLNEVLHSEFWAGDDIPERLKQKIIERQEKFKEFKKYSFSEVISLKDIQEIVSGKVEFVGKQLDGEPLSPGIAYGEVRVVTDPNAADINSWPKDTILVAETTDPGWTALFVQAKGVIVERGGVLSHCSILSREMGLPAVGGIVNIKQKLKDGDKVWVDGNTGRVTRE